ncbi:VWA domain-containing protein [Allonocardiopsis opalescens]|uniref:Ca-activated chloride channel family protein n=1 Tax=Allonocardiopsis opalescens TaxID=1144618 RepID=A0A2T0Q9L7_9ACTN|nr:VWA domain-containing protein [Allonocardiopsis opalescens]PRY00535.1 Ca-activated chloride channel family protein [Allonocardiopsis opalescens]
MTTPPAPGRGPVRRIAAATAALLLAAACTPGPDPAGQAPPGVLRVLGGSELADLEPILADAEEATGVRIELTQSGTLDGLERVAAGEADGEYDALWFSSNHYLSLLPGGRDRVATETPVMASPVVLGVTESAARRLGWDGGAEVGWRDIADAAASGELEYGMTNPAASNSGFSALVAVAAAFSDTGAALREEDVPGVAAELTDFFTGQALTSGSSGWLQQSFAARAADPATALDGLVNYESVLLSLNASGDLPEPLTLVYPAEGAVTAGYPLTLLASADADAAARYEAVAAFLRSAATQERIMAETHRRPAEPSVELAAGFGPASYPELPFPATSGAVDALLAGYLDHYRRPSRTVFVLDFSGSMEGERIDGLRAALGTLAGGAAPEGAARFQRFYGREQVTLLPFNHVPLIPQRFELPADGREDVLADIRAAAAEHPVGGGTAVYDSLERGYQLLAEQAEEDEGEDATDHISTIVLMSDGENTDGGTLADFEAAYAALPADLATVPVFTVLFGDANEAEMERVAELTGGRSFDARTVPLDEVFREIRGYQ